MCGNICSTFFLSHITGPFYTCALRKGVLILYFEGGKLLADKECPKLLCGLGIGHRRRQTISMLNSSRDKIIFQDITVCLGSAVLNTM